MERIVKGFISVILSCMVFVGICIVLNMVSYAIVGGFIIMGLICVASTIYAALSKNEIRHE